MKHAKRIGSLICVIAICFTLMAAPSAHAVGALGGQASGAWIAAGLVALNIVAHTGAQAIGSYFGWQSAPSSQSVLNYTFPNATSVISDYMNASTVVVKQGVTTIDGVEYDEVFVDPGTFTTGLKTNLFDFKTKWNILSGQSNISLASGVGNISGVPIYNINGSKKSQTYTISGNGNYLIGNNLLVKQYGNKYGELRNAADTSGTTYPQWNPPVNIFLTLNTYNNPIIYTVKETDSRYHDGWWLSYDSRPFDYKYTSGVVPAQEVDIPENYGLGIQIPHEQLQTFYNTYPQYNVDNSVINIQQDGIDIDQLTQAIFDQVTAMDQIRAEWKAAEEPEPPEPGPPEPVPPEPAEDVLEGVNTIAGQQYESNQIQYQDYVIQQQQLQQQQQQLQQQQQINENTSNIKEALENATQTPTSEQLPGFKIDLRELFPFCIPFDIYRLLTAFDAEPVAPHVQIPFVIESLNFSYNIDLDFSVFDPVAQVLRTVEFIVYALGLAWATGKVIKW